MKARRFRFSALAIGLLALMAMVSGCEFRQLPQLQEGVYQAEWLAELSDPAEFDIPFRATASLFDDGERAVISTDCNLVNAWFEHGAVTQVLVTAAACPGWPHPLETYVATNLHNGSFDIIDNSHFRVGNLQYSWRVPLGEVIPFEGALLDGEYEGVLTQTDGVVASPLQLGTATLLNDGTMASFFAGCNRLRAPITDSGLGPIASTRMLCPDDSAEQVLLEHLNSGNFVKLSDSSFRVGDIVFSRVR